MILQKFKEIMEELSSSEQEAEKCESGNASAGRRLRKISMSSIKKLKELRALILEQNK